MKVKSFLPYGKPSISKEDIQEVVAVLESDRITRGPKVEEFEQAVATYCGAKYAVAFANGTSALMAAYHAAEVSSFDRVITTPNTFVATVGAGMHYRSTPVFIDIDRDTGNLDLTQMELNVSYPSTRGRNVIVLVHFAGIPVDMQRLEHMVAEPDAILIEDAAHALGSSYPSGEKVGSCAYSAMTTFSFHPVKNITTGEGGMVT
ncbi:MAG: DegT/DnrJ/EryC1/StrS family aminotransferase, partial [Waddliaceae bacterium]